MSLILVHKIVLCKEIKSVMGRNKCSRTANCLAIIELIREKVWSFLGVLIIVAPAAVVSFFFFIWFFSSFICQ